MEILWEDYVKITPDAHKIHNLLESIGETVVNDHFALRTFNQSPISLSHLRQYMIDLGYQPRDEYGFPEKHLLAQYFTKPNEPKVFISELLVEKLSNRSQKICMDLINQSENYFKSNSIELPVKPWENISYTDCEILKMDSDYAAWVACFGIRANHFTVSINHLKNIYGIEELNKILKDHGFILNNRGGEIKGSREEFLMQSSTMAKKIMIPFKDGEYEVASCYYEFAERFPMDDQGNLYEGFIEKSANKIFESTNLGKKSL